MYTTQQLSDELSNAYTALYALVEQMGNIEADLYQAQAHLTNRRAALLRQEYQTSVPLGHNEAQREASLRGQTSIEQQTLAKVEQARLEIKPLLEITRLRVEAARAQLRLLEVQAATGKEHR